ncbi:MAG: hypothetical protein JW959_06475 [Pirellulales bacterium]|nr:hypothetical protein [Pirellulales bacterium]
MDQNQSRLDRIMPKSTFGVTFVTIIVIILILVFFIDGLDLLRMENSDSAQLADRRQVPLDDILPPEPIELPADLMPSDSNTATRIKLWGHYGEDRSEFSPVVEPGYVASLVRTSDCRWSNDAEAPVEGAQFRVGQTLDVAAGLVEIAFACGAKAILEGPAVLELKSEKGGDLRAGRMTADVPDEVEGFTVTTPLAQLVSLSKEQRESAAKLIATADCIWGKGCEYCKKGTYLKPGQKVNLTSGLAEIAFNCGAKAIIEGPACLEIETEKTAILHSGKLTADVPDELEGFKIRTPVAEVISLPVLSQPTDAATPGPGENAQSEAPAKKADEAGETAAPPTAVESK